ncbi:uncharacterized protein [Cherax quadricarinatus]|uniref:uncharacterized protein n=1 Tax=Cherax quadricarinatus TaxID=27406 RepID=UPI002379A7D1|nr:uncharacterized protein LOC128699443 [Cherax quadricarinatus]
MSARAVYVVWVLVVLPAVIMVSQAAHGVTSLQHGVTSLQHGVTSLQHGVASLQHDAQDYHRDGKFLNLQLFPFVSVKVQATECTSQSDNFTGTCTSRPQCTSQKGRADGTCGSGYGVCCVYNAQCGSTVSRNSTYLVNDGYPTTFNAINNCQYTIEKVSADVCQLRLDFEVLRLVGPDNTTQCSDDTLAVTGASGANPSVICGDNSGQHMYLGLASGTRAARVNIATTTTGYDRSWRIKVIQIPCSSPSRAPPNCLQYYTEYSGTVKSFNFQTAGGGKQLANQLYTACIRTREGFCGIRYTSNAFNVSAAGVTPCVTDFVLIPTVAKNGTAASTDRQCGTTFTDVITYSTPFEVRVVTDDKESAGVNSTGFSISYTQIPC